VAQTPLGLRFEARLVRTCFTGLCVQSFRQNATDALGMDTKTSCNLNLSFALPGEGENGLGAFGYSGGIPHALAFFPIVSEGLRDDAGCGRGCAQGVLEAQTVVQVPVENGGRVGQTVQMFFGLPTHGGVSVEFGGTGAVQAGQMFVMTGDFAQTAGAQIAVDFEDNRFHGGNLCTVKSLRSR